LCDDVQLCNCCVRDLLILARTWFAFGLPSKTGCDNGGRAGLDRHWLRPDGGEGRRYLTTMVEGLTQMAGGAWMLAREAGRRRRAEGGDARCRGRRGR
jgi:hypothetical protein